MWPQHRALVQPAGRGPVGALLCARAGERREPAASGSHRPGVHRAAFLRGSTHHTRATHDQRLRRQPQARGAPDARDGLAGYLSKAANLCSRRRPQNLPVEVPPALWSDLSQRFTMVECSDAWHLRQNNAKSRLLGWWRCNKRVQRVNSLLCLPYAGAAVKPSLSIFWRLFSHLDRK